MSSFTRKFYVLTADIIKDSFEEPEASTTLNLNDWNKWRQYKMAVKFSDVFAEDNERFNRELFYEACGISDD